MLKLRDCDELRNDDGGDGVAGDELRAESFPPNCDMIWLKLRLVVTLFFVTDDVTCCCCCIFPGVDCDANGDDAADVVTVVDVCFFCSKMEILSERGVMPEWVSRAAILVFVYFFVSFQIGTRFIFPKNN